MRNAPASPETPAPPAALSPDAAAWLQAHGAVSMRIGSDGIIEFSRRSLTDALTAAARDLLPDVLPSSVARLPEFVTSAQEVAL